MGMGEGLSFGSPCILEFQKKRKSDLVPHYTYCSLDFTTPMQWLAFSVTKINLFLGKNN